MEGRALSVDGRSVDSRPFAADTRSQLSTSGLNIVSPRRPRKSTAQSVQSDAIAKTVGSMTVEEMQLALANQRMPPAERQTKEKEVLCARSILEENKQLIEEKQQRRVMARQSSREFISKLIDDDRRTLEAEKVKEVSKRSAQAELAQYYKSCIAEKEAEKANAYREKLSYGSDAPFFPFTEGECITHARKAQRAEMQSEMQDFLRKQLEENPPRPNFFESRDDQSKYQLGSPSRKPPRPDDVSSPIKEKQRSPTSPSRAIFGTAELIEANLNKAPPFLHKAQEHKSRRVEDEHIRFVLETTVNRKKDELEILAKQRLSEVDGMVEARLVNDALRYDGDRWKRIELKRNADFVRKQMEERQVKQQKDRQEQHAECHGYWGPEEKPPEGKEKLVQLHEDLVKQMEVDQKRKLASRVRRLQQEQHLVNNSLAEIHQDRSKEQNKLMQHKEVLVKTWDSQKVIKSVQQRIESFDS